MLYKRIVTEGTIADPNGKPNPEFALTATVNWMRALRLSIDADQVNFQRSLLFYSNVQKSNISKQAENTVLEQLFLSLHQLSAIQKLKDLSPSADFARISIIAWFYGISNACSAMIAAKDGTYQEDHSGTAKTWERQIAANDLAIAPFSHRVSSLVERVYLPEIVEIKGTSVGSLDRKPTTVGDAVGTLASYLKGTAKWYSEFACEDLLKSKDFKHRGLENFRKKEAQGLRDEYLEKRSIGFLHQANRYRGKANYREALFLGYGHSTNTVLNEYVNDLAHVLEAFLSMAGAFCKMKLGNQIWKEFVEDIDSKAAFSAKTNSVWH